jgi:hypothetical protein
MDILSHQVTVNQIVKYGKRLAIQEMQRLGRNVPPDVFDPRVVYGACHTQMLDLLRREHGVEVSKTVPLSMLEMKSGGSCCGSDSWALKFIHVLQVTDSVTITVPWACIWLCRSTLGM